jgi:hypothetical protein
VTLALSARQRAWARRNAVTYSPSVLPAALLGCPFTESPPPMNTHRLTIARCALGAAWSLAHGVFGVAAKRVAGNGQAPN